jgi:hypothetical protein
LSYDTRTRHVNVGDDSGVRQDAFWAFFLVRGFAAKLGAEHCSEHCRGNNRHAHCISGKITKLHLSFVSESQAKEGNSLQKKLLASQQGAPNVREKQIATRGNATWIRRESDKQ